MDAQSGTGWSKKALLADGETIKQDTLNPYQKPSSCGGEMRPFLETCTFVYDSIRSTGSIGPICSPTIRFDGSVLLPFRTFQSLGLLSKPTADTYRLIMPDSRSIFAYTASEEVAFGPVRVMTKLHASPAVDRSLAGREFLRLIVAKLDGPKDRLTVIVA